MEVVLGIDNLIFISILTNKLPEAHRAKARRIGISLALIMRLALLGMVAFIVKATTPVFAVWGNEFSWRDLILLALAAYASYLVNAAQFLLKLRAARLEGKRWAQAPGGLGLSS